ncbi:hypothetical protein ACIHCV_21865 [Streptomyces sp. NPDC051956]|uniref:hypothetical protein n=1 Tax=Streptomyces sp. NPDC051956 TaxID=3365677 RepID=UPI0037D581B0
MTGLAVKTLHNYRWNWIGQPSTNYRRKVIYKLSDLEAWIAERLVPAVDPERLGESRPPEPRHLPRRP